MMHLINYDLCTPGKDYSTLIKAIQSYGSWARISRSCWIVRSDHTAAQILHDLAQYIDANDLLFVRKISAWAALNFKQEVIDWLNN